MNYIKLNKKIFVDNYEPKNIVVSYGDRIFYSNVASTFNPFEIVPERYRNSFCFLYMEVKNTIPPHTDSGIKCTINFYVNPGTYKTKFWLLKYNNHDSSYKIKNQTNGSLFKYEALEFDNHFQAEPGDVYLLDVTKPHSVEIESPFLRTALCLQSAIYSFQEVKDMLTETGYI